MNWIYLLFLFLQTCVSQWDRYYYYNPYYQYYGRLPPSANNRQRTVSRQSTTQGVQRDQPVRRLDGPNVCKIREVYGTGERFYEEFTEKAPSHVCNRETFIRRSCCTGFSRIPGEDGCTLMKPLVNILSTARNFGLFKFPRLLTNTQLGEELKSTGSFTAFIPKDRAFKNITHADRERLHSWTYNAPTLLHYHVVYGRYNYSTFTKQRDIPTLYYGHKSVRINTYKFGVNTVNCARVIRPNLVASNGLVHVIDRVIKPLDIYGNLANLIARDQRFTQFTRVLYAAKMVDYLQTEEDLTVFVPDNKAMRHITPLLKSLIFKEKSIAEAIVKFHIVKGVHCGAASTGSIKLQAVNEGSLEFRCRYNGKYVNNAKVLAEDIMAQNGVVHAINKVLLPNKVKTVLELSMDLKLKTFVDLVHRAGFVNHLNNRRDFSLFAPSDAAFEALPKSYLLTLQSQPGLVEKLFNYHIVENKYLSDTFFGGRTFPTLMSGTHIKIHTFADKMTVNDAEIENSDNECKNAVIHVISRVLVPPENTLLELVSSQDDLSLFKKALDMANVSDILGDKERQLTVLAPTNAAMAKLDKMFFNDKKLLRKFLLRHMTKEAIISSGLTAGLTFTAPSIQAESVSFRIDPTDKVLWINKQSKAISQDRIALNGYLFKIDRILYCKCSQDG